VAGVDLYLVLPESKEEDDEDFVPRATRSGEDGSFLLASPAAGPHTVRLYHRDFLLTELSVTFPARGARLVLRDGASLDVEVLDEAGLPIVGSEVQLVQRSGSHATDGSGRVTLKGLSARRYHVVAATPADEPLRTVSAEVELRGTEPHSVRLRFAPGQRLSGVVVDARGQPVPGAEVRAVPAALVESAFPEGELGPFSPRFRREWYSGRPHPVRTGLGGRFTLTHLPAGTLLVTARKEGYTLDERTTPGQVRTLDSWPGVLAEPGSGEVRLVLKHQGQVRGRVVRADGSPVSLFHIDGQLHQDASGAFQLPIHASGERVLLFSAPGLAITPRRLQVREGLDTDMGEVVLEDGREVRLRVVDADTGLPVHDALVDVREPGDTESRMDRSLLYAKPPRPGHLREELLLTAEDGTVRLPHVEEQPRVLLVLHCDYLRASVSLGARQRELTVALRPGARLEGEVRLDGRASGRGVVEVRTLEDRHVTDADVREGRYSTCALEPGRYTVQLEAHVFGRRTMPTFASRVVDVPARGTVPVHFDASRDGTTVQVRSAEKLERLLLLPGSWPLPGTRALFLETEARAYRAMHELVSDTHRFKLIPPGHYTLVAVRDSRSRPVELHREELVVPDSEELGVPDSGTFEHELRPRWQPGPDSVEPE
jgi:hypothetical protein